jgi:hypothetical protein
MAPGGTSVGPTPIPRVEVREIVRACAGHGLRWARSWEWTRIASPYPCGKGEVSYESA